MLNAFRNTRLQTATVVKRFAVAYHETLNVVFIQNVKSYLIYVIANRYGSVTVYSRVL